MFARQVYEELGGFDENLDVLEDWDLWVRYASRYSFHMVNKTTSVYRTPAGEAERALRKKILDNALQYVKEKHNSLNNDWTVGALRKDYEEIKEELLYKKMNSQVPAWKRLLVYRAARKLYHVILKP